MHRHSVTIKFQEVGEQPWWFSGIYGPHEDANKPAFPDELREVRSFCAGPWMLTGDFNMIYSSGDKSNDNVNRVLMGRFHRFVNEMELKRDTSIGSSLYLAE